MQKDHVPHKHDAISKGDREQERLDGGQFAGKEQGSRQQADRDCGKKRKEDAFVVLDGGQKIHSGPDDNKLAEQRVAQEGL